MRITAALSTAIVVIGLFLATDTKVIAQSAAEPQLSRQ